MRSFLLFRTTLSPTIDHHYVGSTTTAVIRFGTLTGFGIRETSQGHQPHTVVRAVVASELPYSVLPHDLKIFHGIEIGEAPEEYQSRPAPIWRGVPCSFIVVALWFRNYLVPDHRLTCFDVLMLIPQFSPTATDQLYLSDEQNILLGSEFFIREQFQILLRFDHFFQTPDLNTRYNIHDLSLIHI